MNHSTGSANEGGRLGKSAETDEEDLRKYYDGMGGV